ncbi:MAG: hypothetical protein U1A78_17500 [Polyangia bacterium]
MPADRAEPAEPRVPATSRRRAPGAGGVAPVSWRAGVHITGTRLWCDAPRAHDLCFVSSGTSAAAGASGRRRGSGMLLCTEGTYRLLRALRGEEPRAEPGEPVLLSPVGRPFNYGSLRLELFPSGQGPGAAALWIKLPSGRQVVYAGAPRAESDPRAEPMQVRGADTLVIAARAHVAELPPRGQALLHLRAALERSLAQPGSTLLVGAPLLLAELWPEIGALLAAGQGAAAHPLVHRALAATQRCGLLPESLPLPRRLGWARPLGALGLWPLGTGLPPAERLGGGPVRLLVVDGEAAERGAELSAALPPGLELAAALPFPDGLDATQLSTYARDCEARRVYLTAGYTPALAESLARHRIEAAPLGPPRQLALFGAA